MPEPSPVSPPTAAQGLDTPRRATRGHVQHRAVMCAVTTPGLDGATCSPSTQDQCIDSSAESGRPQGRRVTEFLDGETWPRTGHPPVSPRVTRTTYEKALRHEPTLQPGRQFMTQEHQISVDTFNQIMPLERSSNCFKLVYALLRCASSIAKNPPDG
jgi:hypothetical protein